MSVRVDRLRGDGKDARSLVLPIDVGWSDVGSWKALWEVSSRDGSGNHVRGDVVRSIRRVRC